MTQPRTRRQFRTKRPTLRERFWRMVDRAGDDECWLWTGAVDSSGCGQIVLTGNRLPTRAHHVSWLLHTGEAVPDRTHLRHRCPQVRCVNPAHLYLRRWQDHDAAYVFCEVQGGPRYSVDLTRFWSRVRKSDGCWEWTGARVPHGYGQWAVHTGTTRRRNVYTHRLSYVIEYGPVPVGMRVLHRCDNPPCVRPDHLFLGDQRANIADMYAKGRQPPNPSARLRPEQLPEIRRMHAEGERTLREIGAVFSVSESTIRRVVSGERTGGTTNGEAIATGTGE